MVESTLPFRYVGIPTEHGDVPAICLAYRQKEEAQQAFGVLHEYFISPGGSKSLAGEFTSQSPKEYEPAMFVRTPYRNFDLHSEHVTSRLVAERKEKLQHGMHYAILAGYESGGEFHLLPPKEFHLLQRDLTIDGEVVMGASKVKIDRLGLFHEEG